MIKKIDLEYFCKGNFESSVINNICHIKNLPYLSIVQAIEGSYDIKLGDEKTYNTGKGVFFIAPSEVKQTIVHNTDKISGKMICRWVFLKIKLNDLYLFENLYELPIILPEEQKQELNLIFDRLFSSDNAFEENLCYHEIIALLYKISSEKVGASSSNLSGALSYIKENYKEKISVETLASSVNLSVPHFFMSFKKAFGLSPIAYLNSYRLSLATEMMLNSKMTIKEIAASVGINDSVYFNKLFRKAYQMSPVTYRKIYIKQTALQEPSLQTKSAENN